MKFNIDKILLLVLSVFSLASCALDNYDEPKSTFTGAMLYNGDTICVASRSAVYFEMREPGWQFTTPINVVVKPDGTFSTVLFNGKYKLLLPSSQGPYVNPSDTMNVEISGNTKKDIEVTPYYMIRNAKFAVSGRVITGSCKAEKIITDSRAKNIERVTLYASYTYFADQFTNDVNADAALTDLNNLSVIVTVPAMASKPAQNFVYVRLGIKIAGVDDMIYTSPRKINL
jgi:hypothetical protein